MTKAFKSEGGNFEIVKRALDLLEMLKDFTDEETTISQLELMKLMEKDPLGNERTLSNTLDKILIAVNPPEFDEDNSEQYKILYRGYEENLVQLRHEIKKKKAEENKKARDAKSQNPPIAYEKMRFPRIPSITDLRFVHDFTFDELDALINSIYYSKTLSDDEKLNLIDKVSNLSSKKYRQKWVSTKDGKVQLKSILQGIVENTEKFNDNVLSTFKLISSAIEKRKKISFVFNGYDFEKKLSPIKNAAGESIIHSVTPYHVVAYNGKQYMVANHDGYDNASIWRLDLMSEIQIIEDSIGRARKDIKELPARWNATEYMEKHLYMFYDEPIDIQLKIPNNRYTVLYDWFGDNFQRILPLDDKYDLVKIKCSPKAMVCWAMQYGDLVKVVNPKWIKEEICKKCNQLAENYANM